MHRNVFLIYDKPEYLESVRKKLLSEIQDIDCVHISDEDMFNAYLKDGKLDVVVTDYKLSWSNGIKLLQIIKHEMPLCPVIMFTASGNEDIAVRAMKSGAYDYIRLIKSNLNRLAIVTKNALSRPEPIYSILDRETRYYAWLSGVPAGLFCLDSQGKVLILNTDARIVLAYDPEAEPREMYFQDFLVDTSVWELLTGNLKEIDATESVVAECKKIDGTEFTAGIKIRLTLDPDGSTRIYEGFIQDISKWVAAEAALRESEEKFEKFTAEINDVIYRYDPETNHYDFISPSIEQITGYTQSEIMADPRGMLRKLAHPDDVEYVFQVVRDHLAKGPGAGPLTREYRLLNKDGREIYVSDRVTFEFKDDGTLNRVNGVLHDITGEKNSIWELEKEKRFSENLIETANALVVQMDAQGQITRVNSFAENVLGYSREELVGQNWFQAVLDPLHAEKVKVLFDRKLATGIRHWESEHIVVCRNKRRRIISWRYSLIAGNGDDVQGVLTIGIDMTAHYEAEKDKENLKTQLFYLQKMEAVGVLAGGLANEFNTILTSILGHLDMVLMSLDDTASFYSDLVQIKKLTKRAGKSVRNLLIFGRKEPMKPQTLDINSVIENLHESFQRLITPDVELQIDLADSLPEIKADKGHIEQVLMNLVMNANDAIPGKGNIRISTTKVSFTDRQTRKIPRALPGKFIKIAVSDTGTGMDESVLEHIFEPFFTTEDGRTSIGFGLATAYGIVTRHNGWIDITSEKNKGTTVRVYLPVKKAAVKPAKKAVAKNALQGAGQRILMIEDEEAILKLTARGLKKAGYTVFTAADSKSAMDIFIREGGNFDLIFSDIILPDKNGYELVREFQGIQRGFKVLFCSGFSESYLRKTTRFRSKFPLLAKPYSLMDILEAIKKLLNR